jgi:hypothetical protein
VSRDAVTPTYLTDNIPFFLFYGTFYYTLFSILLFSFNTILGEYFVVVNNATNIGCLLLLINSQYRIITEQGNVSSFLVVTAEYSRVGV